MQLIVARISRTDKRSQLKPIPSKRLLTAGYVVDIIIKILMRLNMLPEGVIHQDIKPAIFIEQRSSSLFWLIGIAHSAIAEMFSKLHFGSPL
jgi:hypothetical protein